MENRKNLLVIANSDHCAYSYPNRKSLADIAYILPDIPSDDILSNVEIAFVDISLPGADSIVEELREYAHECGGIQRIIGYSSGTTLSVEEMLRLAVKAEEAGAEFIPQFI
jgi:hypothetical protein